MSMYYELLDESLREKEPEIIEEVKTEIQSIEEATLEDMFLHYYQ